MHAKPGDQLVVSGHRVGERSRRAEIIEVRGDQGSPPYYVRWSDGHESVVYPGPDIAVEHATRSRKKG
ncbi:MAG TPA: DUF1918 domain-containing protein [Acidimicrobiia bacterium]|nr:DUF1918 domain-containing protein [Acidimicrobiia bacterium]